jgi:hypothetical protein
LSLKIHIFLLQKPWSHPLVNLEDEVCHASAQWDAEDVAIDHTFNQLFWAQEKAETTQVGLSMHQPAVPRLAAI